MQASKSKGKGKGSKESTSLDLAPEKEEVKDSVKAELAFASVEGVEDGTAQDQDQEAVAGKREDDDDDAGKATGAAKDNDAAA